ncbi:MAG: hypothetical protein KAS32_16865, partial [Candidatus Peribacteraceae bacterium]|nr:hypothetical protein [Candidatus Peribacteraceae bacterium]
FLEESTPVNEFDPIWQNDTTYLKLYDIQYINTADLWETSRGFQDTNIYTYPNDKFIKTPIFNGNFKLTDNKIELISDNLADWGKISGYEIIEPTSVAMGQDAISNPNDIADIASIGVSAWYYYPESESWSDQDSATIVGVADVNNVTDKDDSTFNRTFLEKDNIFGIITCSIYRIELNAIDSDELFLITSNDSESNVGEGLFSETNSVNVYIKNAFQDARVSLLDSSSGGKIKVFNYPKDYLSNFTPPSEFEKNYPWWGQYANANVVGDDYEWYIGNELAKLDSFNPLTKHTPVFYIGYINSSIVDIPEKTRNIDQKVRQFNIAAKIDDIDFTKGIYSAWWGREFSTTDFGSGATDLIENSQDVLNHILRLQNYEQDLLSPPSLGWGLEYISDYTTVLDNSTSYGGLQYLDFDSIVCAAELFKQSNVNTKKMKEKLCKEAWLLSAVNAEGKESIYPMEKAFDQSMTRTTINYLNFKGNVLTISDRPSTDVFCTPFVQYNKNYATETYDNKISITNPESSTYDSSYVTGVTNPSIAEALWTKAHVLYEKYQIVNDVPESMTKLDWIRTEENAIIYLTNWLEWMGGTSSGFVDRREITPPVIPYEFAVDNDLDFGSLIQLDIPFVDGTKELNGIISRISYDLNMKNPTCKITAFVELRIATTGDKLLQENGSYILQENGSFILL